MSERSPVVAKCFAIGMCSIGIGIPFAVAVYVSSPWWLLLYVITLMYTTAQIKNMIF